MNGSTRNEGGKGLLIGTAVIALSVSGGTTLANPVGGQVVAGSASIDQTRPGQTVVTQQSNSAVINWQDFSVGQGESTTFQQPSASSVVLNRVTGGDPSQILGQLNANGNVFIVNANGVVFGSDARVDVNGLVATTHDIRNDDFMAGNYRFTIPGNPRAMVINRGLITAADAGLVALVAPAVRNDGVIAARLGRVALAGANGFTLDLYGDGLVQLAVNPVTLQAFTPEGRPVSALVVNDGTLLAEGGTVLLTANAARGVVDNVINNSGLIAANSARQAGGQIILEATGGDVAVTGTLDASGTRGGRVEVRGDEVMVSGDARITATGAGGRGGRVQLLGERVGLTDHATVDVSGETGGGTVLVGGGYQGKDPAIENATAVYFGADAAIHADALHSGNGGKVILWSDEVTRAYGTISARGGSDSGNGGFVETSSKGALVVAGLDVDAGADHGSAGKWLLDPVDVTVVHSTSPGSGVFNPPSSSTIADYDIIQALNSGTAVTITTSGGTDGNGDITVANGVSINYTYPGLGSLTFHADRNIVVQGGASITAGMYPLNLTFESGGSTTIGNGSTIDLGTGGLFFSGGPLNLVGQYTNVSDARFVSLDGSVLNFVSGPHLTSVTLGDDSYAASLSVRGDVHLFNGVRIDGTVDKGNGAWYVHGSGVQLIDSAGSFATLVSAGGGIYSTGNTANTQTVQLGDWLMMEGYLTLGDANAAQSFTLAGYLDATNASQEINITTGTFTLDGGYLQGSGDINVTGNMNVRGGGLYGTGLLTTSGTTNINDGVDATQSTFNVVGKRWRNTGTVNVRGNDNIVLQAGAVMTNAAGGVINLATLNGMPINGGEGFGTLNNAGLVNHLVSGNHAISPLIDVNNSGTIRVQQGIFDLAGGGVSSGTFVIDGGATLVFGGPQTLGSIKNVTGDGAVLFPAAGTTFSDSVSVLAGSAVNFTLAGGPMVLSSIGQPVHGTVIDNGDGSWTYIPEAGYSGSDSFHYVVTDGAGGTASGVINLTIASIPGAVEDPEPVILASNDYLPAPGDAPEIVVDDGSRPVPSPSLAGLPLLEGVEALDNYSPEERAAYYDSLTVEQVVDGLKDADHSELADFFGATAAGGGNSAAELRRLLIKSGLAHAQQGWLGVYMRMRRIDMERRLASAIDVLKSNPDAADEVDDGVAGGPIDIDAPTRLRSADGLLQLSGRIRSASRAVELRFDGRWVHLDDEGRFSFRTAVPAGARTLLLQAQDPAGMRKSVAVEVSSAVQGRMTPGRGRRIALLLPVQEYDNSIPELETPVADAEALAGTLQGHYGFEARVLANPTKREIMDALRALAAELTEEDSLTVFYAGHGYLMQETGRGYWLPRDADTGNPRNWVSNRDVARLFQRTRARQILLVSDSCYSGAFVREGAQVETDAANLAGRAVMAFSSGGEEPVWDGGGEGHSLFAAQLLAGLAQGRNASGAQLFDAVRTGVVKVSPQVPQYGAMVSAGYDPGADYALK